MFSEFEFEDIIFGVFPKVGSDTLLAYGFWAKNSVGDIVEMLLQMLEVRLPFTSATLMNTRSPSNRPWISFMSLTLPIA